MEETIENASESSTKLVQRDKNGRLLPGSTLNPTGHPAGLRNQATAIKSAFYSAFQAIGGMERLIAWIKESKTNEREFFKLLLPLLPKELDVRNDNGEGMKLIIIRSAEKIGGDTKVDVAVLTSK